MKIVHIIGGLGNQMFQYAFLVALQERYPKDEVLMDVSSFNGYKLHNGFELERVFNITARKASKKELKMLTYYTCNYKIQRFIRKILPKGKKEFIENNDISFDPNVMSIGGSIYYEGYWQSPKYFENIRSILLLEFQWKGLIDKKNSAFIEKIELSLIPTVSLHIRRGDYLENPLYKGICDLNYYKKAIDYVFSKYTQRVHFIVFSNDISWCKENILPLIYGSDYTFVDWNNGTNNYMDMRLMSACRVNIVANSSFSWWGAYLNNNLNKEVIAPQKWINEPKKVSPQMQSWILF